MKKCKNPKCLKPFIPILNQKYCCPECKSVAKNIRAWKREKEKLSEELKISKKRKITRSMLIRIAKAHGREVEIEKGKGYEKIIFHPSLFRSVSFRMW